MKVDAALGSAAVGGGDRDVDGPADRFEELPKRRRGVVAQNRSVAASEDCGHPTSVPTRSSVSDRVDAAVEAMKTPVSHPSSHCALAHAERFELFQRHDTMLPLCDFRHALIGRVELVTHEVTKSTGLRGSPPYPAAVRPSERLRSYAALGFIAPATRSTERNRFATVSL